jgi:hypothetical protein
MAENTNSIKVVLKKKQISILVDFCLDESIEFGVKQQAFPGTDWEVELKLNDIKTAIMVGMFLRENRFDIEGVDQQRYKKTAGAKKSEEKTETSAKTESAVKTKTDSEDASTPTLM